MCSLQSSGNTGKFLEPRAPQHHEPLHVTNSCGYRLVSGGIPSATLRAGAVQGSVGCGASLPLEAGAAPGGLSPVPVRLLPPRARRRRPALTPAPPPVPPQGRRGRRRQQQCQRCAHSCRGRSLRVGGGGSLAKAGHRGELQPCSRGRRRDRTHRADAAAVLRRALHAAGPGRAAALRLQAVAAICQRPPEDPRPIRTVGSVSSDGCRPRSGPQHTGGESGTEGARSRRLPADLPHPILLPRDAAPSNPRPVPPPPTQDQRPLPVPPLPHCPCDGWVRAGAVPGEGGGGAGGHEDLLRLLSALQRAGQPAGQPREGLRLRLSLLLALHYPCAHRPCLRASWHVLLLASEAAEQHG